MSSNVEPVGDFLVTDPESGDNRLHRAPSCKRRPAIALKLNTRWRSSASSPKARSSTAQDRHKQCQARQGHKQNQRRRCQNSGHVTAAQSFRHDGAGQKPKTGRQRHHQPVKLFYFQHNVAPPLVEANLKKKTIFRRSLSPPCDKNRNPLSRPLSRPRSCRRPSGLSPVPSPPPA